MRGARPPLVAILVFDVILAQLILDLRGPEHAHPATSKVTLPNRPNPKTIELRGRSRLSEDQVTKFFHGALARILSLGRRDELRHGLSNRTNRTKLSSLSASSASCSRIVAVVATLASSNHGSTFDSITATILNRLSMNSCS
jgi:hypothetical protein